MAVWAIADLHLSFSVPDKSMDIFGARWENHAERVATHWKASIKEDDLVLIPGDISWAMTTEQAKVDLDWIHDLPGKKVLLRGNHDYWWTSLSKVKKVLPPSIYVIQNDALILDGIAIGGARLWDTDQYNFDEYIEYKENPRERKLQEKGSSAENRKIFERELLRLETSLKEMAAKAKSNEKRIVMTHYPPIGADLAASEVSALLEKYHVDICVFGHLHNLLQEGIPFGVREGVEYVFCACDALDCQPVLLLK